MPIFNLSVNTNTSQGTIAGELGPVQAKGSQGSVGADAWTGLREIGDFFEAASAGAWNVRVQYTDGLTNATGTITFTGNLSNNDTVTIAGVVTTFVTGTASGAQVKIGANQAATMQAFVTYINAGGNALNLAPYVTAALTSSTVITLTSVYPGPVGNLITASKAASSISAITSPLAGGAISAGSNPASVLSAGF